MHRARRSGEDYYRPNRGAKLRRMDAFRRTARRWGARRLVLVTVTLSSAVLFGGTGSSSRPIRSLTAPTWRVGDWWRIRVPLQTGHAARADGKPAPKVEDSPTEAVGYRFQVLELQTLRYEYQEGPRHIGQSVPPEECWTVRVTVEPGRNALGRDSYLLYFRRDDRSVRQIVRQAPDGSRRDGDFLYSSTHLDEESRPKLFRGRSVYRSSIEPVILDWPVFPLTRTILPGEKARAGGQERQSVRSTRVSLRTGQQQALRVTLGRGGVDGTTVQDWAPGYPWWVYSERDGLVKSHLIETNRGKVAGP